MAKPQHLALVVEDDEDVRDVVKMLLTILGFDVREASNGRDALELLQETRPDLIVLDLIMPVMNGWEFRAAQRKIPGLANVPVIVLSGREPPWRQADDPEFAEILPKPFEIDGFLKAVARHFPTTETLAGGIAR